MLFDQKDWRFVLGDPDREPMPGFSAAIEGITAQEGRTFELTFPEADETYDETLRGRTVRFQVTCQEVSARHVPSINDDFAQQVDEYEAGTLLELRMKVRENLQKTLTERAEREYAEQVLNAMVEGAAIEFPEAMVEDYIDDMIQSFEQTLRRQRLTLQDYLKFNQMDEAKLREDYREPAIARLKRSLVLGELVKAQQLGVDDAALDQAAKERSAQLSLGDESMQAFFEQYYGGEQARRDLAIDVITQRVYQRLVEIGRGENPPLGPTPTAAEAGSPQAPAEPVAEPTVETTAAAGQADAPAPQAPGQDSAEAAT